MSIIPAILEPKGYKMIDTFNMSAAFAYDGAAQFDGLHMVGPTIKTLITKILHHVCIGTTVL